MYSVELRGDIVTTSESEFIARYEFHGLDLERVDDNNYGCDCPFCDRPKFRVNLVNGVYQCWVCGEQGGWSEFIRAIHGLGQSTTTNDDLEELCVESALPVQAATTFSQWGVIKHPITGEWAIPGYHWLREVSNSGATTYQSVMGGLYVHRTMERNGKLSKILMTAKGSSHTLLGLDQLAYTERGEPTHNTIMITEGWRDGVTMSFALNHYARLRKHQGGLNPFKDWGVVSIPGTQVYKHTWSTLFRNRDVVICYDNDHPTVTNTGTKQQGGPAGVTKLGSILLGLKPADQPSNVRYLNWGAVWPGEYNPDIRKGSDIRDLFTQGVAGVSL